MPTSYTDLIRAAKQATGENNNTWGNIANTNTFEIFEDAIAGMATVNVAGSGDYTLTTNNGSPDEARCAILDFTGLMTADRNIIVPTSFKTYIVRHSATGGYKLTIKTSAGTGVEVLPTIVKTLFCDAVNVVEASSSLPSPTGIVVKDCVSIAFADSPYSVTSADSGKLFIVNTSGGAVVVNLPQISTVITTPTTAFNVGFKKLTGDTNSVTINRGGSDVIDNGDTSFQIARQEGVVMVADADPATDRWISEGFGSTVTSGQQGVQTFTGGADYTAGSTTTLTLTSTPIAPSSASLDILFDGVYQHPSEWSYNASTGVITFGSAIPVGVLKVFTKWQSVSLPIGVPSDGSVTYIKHDSGSLASTADILAGTASKIVTAAAAQGVLGMVLLSTQTASSSASLNFTSVITSAYDQYIFVLQDIVPATDNVSLYLRTSTNNGSSYDSGGSDYRQAGANNISGSSGTFSLAAAAAGQITLGSGMGNASGESLSGEITFYNPLGATVHKHAIYRTSYITASSGELSVYQGTLERTSSSEIDAIQFFMSSGNITSGIIRCYGVKK